MMAQNNNNHNKQFLRELLQEDQEPFFLKDYIADRRSQLMIKRSSSSSPKKTHLQLNKRSKPSPISSSKQQNFPGKFCFFSTTTATSSPDVRKSPLFEFPSPVSKSPCKGNPILLHVPARTAALLLEAALRIQKQSSDNNSKPKTQMKNQGFGLLGSFLKRLTHRNRRREIGQNVLETTMSSSSTSTSTSTSSSSSSSSSCNEEKSLDLETSSSSGRTSHCDREEADGIEFVRKLMMIREVDYDDVDDGGDDDDDDDFCGHQSPFRFVLQKSPSAGHRTPEFSSPATSPFHAQYKQEEKENYVVESSKEFQIKEEEEEKEQFSPVSVLDPPFEDDYDARDDDEDEDGDGFDLESSYAIVQRTKNQLLQKLRRFEKLAELDPIELEKRMLEQEEDGNDDENDDLEEEDQECDEFESNLNPSLDGFIQGVLSESSFYRVHQAPEHMKRLVSDLIVEESRERNRYIEEREEDDEIVKRVCKRFESWKEVQSNTIDMMVEQDFRKELEGWKNNKEQIGETAMEIELAIFGFLVEELAQEFV